MFAFLNDEPTKVVIKATTFFSNWKGNIWKEFVVKLVVVLIRYGGTSRELKFGRSYTNFYTGVHMYEWNSHVSRIKYSTDQRIETEICIIKIRHGPIDLTRRRFGFWNPILKVQFVNKLIS